MQPPVLDFAQMCQELSERSTFGAQNTAETLQQLRIREMFEPPELITESHEGMIPHRSARPPAPRQGAIAPTNARATQVIANAVHVVASARRGALSRVSTIFARAQPELGQATSLRKGVLNGGDDRFEPSTRTPIRAARILLRSSPKASVRSALRGSKPARPSNDRGPYARRTTEFSAALHWYDTLSVPAAKLE